MQKLKKPINIILTIEIQMKNLGTSLRRGLKIMKYNHLLKKFKSIRKTSEHHCGEGCLILIIFCNNISHINIRYAFGLKTAPASRLGQEQINNYSNIQLIYCKVFLKVGGSPGQPPPWNTPKWDWVRQIPVVKWQSDA